MVSLFIHTLMWKILLVDSGQKTGGSGSFKELPWLCIVSFSLLYLLSRSLPYYKDDRLDITRPTSCLVILGLWSWSFRVIIDVSCTKVVILVVGEVVTLCD